MDERKRMIALGAVRRKATARYYPDWRLDKERVVWRDYHGWWFVRDDKEKDKVWRGFFTEQEALAFYLKNKEV